MTSSLPFPILALLPLPHCASMWQICFQSNSFCHKTVDGTCFDFLKHFTIKTQK